MKKKRTKPRPNKKICVYDHMSIFYFFTIGKTGKSFPVPESDISFSKFLVSRHLLKLFYDELPSFSTFFAVNFDKKLAVE